MYKPYNNVYPMGKHDLVQKRKLRKKVKTKLIFILVFVAVVFTFLLFLRSPYFAIEEIIIEGTEEIAEEEIYMIMEVKEGMNMWKVPPAEVRERISSLTRVDEVTVERVLPDKMRIVIEEKQAQALVPYDGGYLKLAPQGIVIDKKEEKGEEELPVISGLVEGHLNIGMEIQDQRKREVAQVFMEMYQEISLPAKEMNVENPQDILLYTREGMKVRLGSAEKLSQKFELLPDLYDTVNAMEKDPSEGYIDLRTTEAPVFKPF